MRYRGVACGQFRFLLRPQGADRALPGEGPVTGAARQRNPQHFRMCAQARHRFTQVIHIVMHSKACNTFSCRAGRQRVSVPGIAGGGRHPGRGSGLRLDDIAPDGGHRILAAHPAGQAARVPSRPPAVTLTVIPPAAPPRYAQAARAQSPPALALRLRHHGHEPEREAPVPNRRPGSVADHRPATAAAGALAPRRRRCSRRRGTQSCGLALWRSCTGLLPTRRLSRLPPPARRGGPGMLALLGRTPDHRGRHSAVAGGAGPGNTFLPAESGTAPPCMRWRGRARPRRAGWPVAWSSPRAARRGQVPARGAGLPAPPAFPASPRVVPVSSGESIITHRARPCRQPFLVFPLSTRNPQRVGSYPHFTAVIHGFTYSLPTGYRI